MMNLVRCAHHWLGERPLVMKSRSSSLADTSHIVIPLITTLVHRPITEGKGNVNRRRVIKGPGDEQRPTI